MRTVAARPPWIALFLFLSVAVPASAQQTAQSAATLRATATFASNGSLAGTITINHFEQRGTQIVAAGIVQGTLSRANRTIGTNVDLLGAQVVLDPVGLTLNGAAGTPLGDLVCAASDLLGNVAGLVNLLNSVLGIVTGLLGGLTGGLAGIGG